MGELAHESTRDGWWTLHVDLTGSLLKPPGTWLSVDLTLDDVGWPPERIRLEAATYYGVPLSQVGEPRFFREPAIPEPPEPVDVT